VYEGHAPIIRRCYAQRVNPFGVLKPEYVYRPRQLVRRLLDGRRVPGSFIDAPLPWGASIRVRTGDAIGDAVLQLGVLDLAVTEVFLRLAEAGETAIDAGANVGYMTALLAHRVH